MKYLKVFLKTIIKLQIKAPFKFESLTKITIKNFFNQQQILHKE